MSASYDLVGCSLLGFSVHGISQARILEWVAIPFPRRLPDSGTEPTSPTLAGGFFTTEPQEKPLNKHTERIPPLKPIYLHIYTYTHSFHKLISTIQ